MNATEKPASINLISAAPGWRVVTADLTGPGTLFRHPVIAFFVEVDTDDGPGQPFFTVTPIIATGNIDHAPYALQFGDKPPFYTLHADYDSEASLFCYLREQDRLCRRK